MQNPTDACRLMATHYPGGIAALAVRLDVSYEVLRKELSGASTFKLGVERACLISQLCVEAGSEHCNAYANAVAANCGGFVRLQVRDDMRGSGSVYGSAAGLVKECADVAQAVAGAMRDGSISANDRKAIEKELRELLEQVQTFEADVDVEARRGARGPRGV